jgi:Xaa-Pro aminopeptidase
MSPDKERIERIQAALKEAELDAIVSTLPANVLLLTGYWPVVGTALAIATSKGKTLLIAPEDEQELAQQSGVEDIRTFQPASLKEITTAVEALRDPLSEAIRDLGLEQAKIGYAAGEGFEPASYISQHIYGEDLFNLIEDLLTSGSLITAGEVLAFLRAALTTQELAHVRKACRVAESAYADGARELRAGLRETEAAAYFRVPLSVKGTGCNGIQRADGLVSCMSGVNSANAYGSYARSTGKRIAAGDLVLVHCNSYADGYWTDITRTYSLGKPDAKKRAMYEAVLAAREAALAKIRPGADAGEIDAAARGVLTERGFGPQFKHPTGHGVGFAAIDYNAMPRLHPQSVETLETGMVFNVEPAIYLEGYGGVRHCDMVAVTESGVELLTPFQSTIEELTV